MWSISAAHFIMINEDVWLPFKLYMTGNKCAILIYHDSGAGVIVTRIYVARFLTIK